MGIDLYYQNTILCCQCPTSPARDGNSGGKRKSDSTTKASINKSTEEKRDFPSAHEGAGLLKMCQDNARAPGRPAF